MDYTNFDNFPVMTFAPFGPNLLPLVSLLSSSELVSSSQIGLSLNPLETNLVNLLVLDVCLFYVLGDIVGGALNEQLGGILSELFQRKEKCSKSFRKATRAGRFVAFWHHLWLCADPGSSPENSDGVLGEVSPASRTPFVRRLYMVAQEAKILATREILKELPLYPKTMSPSLRRFLLKAPRFVGGPKAERDFMNWALVYGQGVSLIPASLMPPGPRGFPCFRRSLGMGELGETGRERWRFWRIREDLSMVGRHTRTDAAYWECLRAGLAYSNNKHQSYSWRASRLRQRIAETMGPLPSVPEYRKEECRRERQDYFVDRYGSCLLQTTSPQPAKLPRPWVRAVDPRWSWSVSRSSPFETLNEMRSSVGIEAKPFREWYKAVISPSCREEINRYFGKRLLRLVCSKLS